MKINSFGRMLRGSGVSEKGCLSKKCTKPKSAHFNYIYCPTLDLKRLFLIFRIKQCIQELKKQWTAVFDYLDLGYNHNHNAVLL